MCTRIWLQLLHHVAVVRWMQSRNPLPLPHSIPDLGSKGKSRALGHRSLFVGPHSS